MEINISKGIYIISRDDLQDMLRSSYRDAQNKKSLNYDAIIKKVLK